MTDVFISYKRRLRPRVTRIAAALETLGLEVWYDGGIIPGASFTAEIGTQIKTARSVLVCWSPDVFEQAAGQASWVLAEASMGRDRQVLVPVTLEPTLLEPPWNIMHHEDLSDWDPDDPTTDRSGWQQVLVAIGNHVGRPGLSDFDRAFFSPGITPLRKWAQKYPDDKLAAGAWDEIERREKDGQHFSRQMPPAAPSYAEPRPRAAEPQPQPQPQAQAQPAERPAVDVPPPSARDSLAPAGPWSRYFARQLDLTIWGSVGTFVLGILLALFSPANFFALVSQSDVVLGILAVAIGSLVNGIVFAFFATTIGKALFGIRVFRPGSDARVPVGAALKRELMVWVRGLGLGVPLFSLITFIIEFRRVNAKKPASYDDGEFLVRQKPITAGRRTFAILLSIGLIVGISLLIAYSSASSPTSLVWTNPDTGKQVTLSGAWTATPQAAPDGTKSTLLSNYDTGLQLVVGLETSSTVATLDVYTSALTEALKGEVTFNKWTPSGSNLTIATGKLNGSLPVIAYVWKLGANFWRIIYIDMTGKRTGSFADTDMVNAIAKTF